MALNKIKLGKYIQLFSEQCNIPNLEKDDVSGINREKEFFAPTNQIGQDTSKYQIVPPEHFACNLMHVGRDVVLPIAYNHTETNKIVSPAYHVFKFIENEELSSEYFFLFLKSTERDRYFWFNTDSSIRDGMSWDDFIDVDIELPPLEIQQKYVDIYNAMLANQKSYERGLDDLKLVCDAYIENLRREIPCEAIGPYITPIDQRISDLKITLAQGITINKEFSDPKQIAESEKSAKIVRTDQFAYNRATTRNGEKISIAYREGEDCVVSSAYQVFEIIQKNKLDPCYLMMWFKRAEFDRYARYMSKGSAHEFFEYSDMEEVKIPIPNIDVQKSISNIYKVYKERKAINEQLKSQIKDICPILIKGSIEEGKKSTEK